MKNPRDFFQRLSKKAVDFQKTGETRSEVTGRKASQKVAY
jgi:hypothetical protein